MRMLQGAKWSDSVEDENRLTQEILSLPDLQAAIPPRATIRYELYRVGSAFLHT
jgi:hypothetical protein